MNAFEQLLSLPDSEKQAQGIQYTPDEIAQQPEMWLKACDILAEQRDTIEAFLKEAGLKGEKKATVILSGAGSSEYIGNAVSYGLRRCLKRQVISVADHRFYYIILIHFLPTGGSMSSYHLPDQAILRSLSRLTILSNNWRRRQSRLSLHAIKMVNLPGQQKRIRILFVSSYPKQPTINPLS